MLGRGPGASDQLLVELYVDCFGWELQGVAGAPHGDEVRRAQGAAQLGHESGWVVVVLSTG